MTFRLSFLAALACAALAPGLQAITPPLLREAVDHWKTGNNDWAFTQRAKTYDSDNKLTQERLERFDPSKPDDQRWHLLEMNGKPPTDEERKQWQDRKNQKPRKNSNKPLDDLFYFEGATLVAETPQAATYTVAVQPVLAHLVAVDKLNVAFTVNKKTKTIEHVTADLNEPMRVALGLAKVTDIDLDLSFDAKPASRKSPPADEKASGTASMAMSKVIGDRIEYFWSDFERVTRNVSGMATK